MSHPICRHCAAGVQLFKWCRNLSAGTVMQGCSCLSGVETYLLALCCRDAAIKGVSKPICGTVLQGCSCLSGVETYLSALCCRVAAVLAGVATYLLALCCRGAAVKVVSKPICRHSVAGVQLFKWCQNLSAGTVLQGCSCLSGVEIYLLVLCCRVQLFKRCRNLPARHCAAGV